MPSMNVFARKAAEEIAWLVRDKFANDPMRMMSAEFEWGIAAIIERHFDGEMKRAEKYRHKLITLYASLENLADAMREEIKELEEAAPCPK